MISLVVDITTFACASGRRRGRLSTSPAVPWEHGRLSSKRRPVPLKNRQPRTGSLALHLNYAEESGHWNSNDQWVGFNFGWFYSQNVGAWTKIRLSRAMVWLLGWKASLNPLTHCLPSKESTGARESPSGLMLFDQDASTMETTVWSRWAYRVDILKLTNPLWPATDCSGSSKACESKPCRDFETRKC